MVDGENNLIRDAIRGESSAFGSLYDHYQPRIYRFVFLKVGRREEAEDITHQVFLSAWNTIPTYKSLGFPFSSWLYRIARNKVIDYYRAQKNTVNIEAVEDKLIYQGESPVSALETKIELVKIQSAIRELKSEHQEVIIMRFVEDMPIKEVADALGKSEGAIKLLQHRAIKSLKNIVEKN